MPVRTKNIKALRDIYTLREITRDSGEHIIPNFLGGRWEAKGLLDRTTNSEFGSGIEAALEQAFRPLRLVLDGRKGDRRTKPGRPINVEGVDGNTYQLLPGGKLAVCPSFQIYETDNGFTIGGRFRDRKQIREAIKNYAKKCGQNPDTLALQLFESAVTIDEDAPAFKLDISLNDQCWRAIAKMACNLFASHHRELFLSQEFNEIREFVWAGTGHVQNFVDVSEIDISGTTGLGVFDHLITIQMDDAGHVRGGVVLYGYFAFVVRLGQTGSTTETKHSYRVDQFGRSDRKDDFGDTSLEFEDFEFAAARSPQAFRAVLNCQAARLFSAVDIWVQLGTLNEYLNLCETDEDRVHAFRHFVTRLCRR